MKTYLAAGLTAAMTMAGASVASAQVIDPVCASAAASLGLTSGYNIAYDAPNNRCIATPIGGGAALLPGGLTPGAAAGIGIGAAVIIAISVSGDT